MGATPLLQIRHAKRTLSGVPVTWDYFTAPEGPQAGIVRDISSQGLMLCSSVEIEERRWLRLVLTHPIHNIARVIRGRLIRQEPALDSWPDEQITLYRHEIELIDALPQDWVEALENPALSVCRCGSLLEKRKPADPISLSDEICGLCHLRSALTI
ncbi:MAG: hypothetical protein KGQ59_02205 [Bdellovibrionales bacterium]|nr:hypothetical protein [Bdellovibrionales bacterium]